jgi:transposase InsO family protein
VFRVVVVVVEGGNIYGFFPIFGLSFNRRVNLCSGAFFFDAGKNMSDPSDPIGFGKRKKRGHNWSRKKQKATTEHEKDKKEELVVDEEEGEDKETDEKRFEQGGGEEGSWETILDEIYSTPGNPGAFYSSPDKLQKILIDKYDINVTLNQIKNWLSHKYSHSLHKRYAIRFKRNQIMATDIDEQWQGDLFFIDEFGKQNKGFKCGLVIIDVVSRFGWVELMKDKTGPTTTEAFKQILKRAHPRKPKRLQTDKGTEFLNQTFQNFLKQHDIDFFTTFSDHKAAIAERFIKTLKGLIYKYLDEHNTNIYWDKIQDIVRSYNGTYHSTIKTAPDSVTKENVGGVLNTLYSHMWKSGDRLKQRKIKFKVNDYVRLSKIHAEHFRKGYKGNWSVEIFKVSKIKNTFPHITYGVSDFNGKEIMGSYYEHELQLVPEIDIKKQYWKIEKFIRYRTSASGKREALVKWLGYDDSFNSWISADDVKSIKKSSNV